MNNIGQISVRRSDPEHRIGISAGYGTSVNTGFAGLLALITSIIFFAALYFLPENWFKSMLMERGPTQYIAVFLGLWCAVILIFKRRKLSVQANALGCNIIPEGGDFVLTSQTADVLIENVYSVAEDPERFILYNRILTAIANLKNLGRVSDVDEILRSVGERDESAHQTSFAMLNGFLWAIPVLGFIGTVLGLAKSIGQFSSLLQKDSEMTQLIESLKNVTGGLSTAFETTLLALAVALFVQLWSTSQKKAEEDFLDQCHDYCLKNIVNRIRILAFEEQRQI